MCRQYYKYMGYAVYYLLMMKSVWVDQDRPNAPNKIYIHSFTLSFIYYLFIYIYILESRCLVALCLCLTFLRGMKQTAIIYPTWRSWSEISAILGDGNRIVCLLKVPILSSSSSSLLLAFFLLLINITCTEIQTMMTFITTLYFHMIAWESLFFIYKTHAHTSTTR